MRVLKEIPHEEVRIYQPPESSSSSIHPLISIHPPQVLVTAGRESKCLPPPPLTGPPPPPATPHRPQQVCMIYLPLALSNNPAHTRLIIKRNKFLPRTDATNWRLLGWYGTGTSVSVCYITSQQIYPSAFQTAKYYTLHYSESGTLLLYSVRFSATRAAGNFSLTSARERNDDRCVVGGSTTDQLCGTG